MERLLAIGVNVDDNEKIGIFAYHHEAKEIGVVNDNVLYERILGELPQWYQAAKKSAYYQLK